MLSHQVFISAEQIAQARCAHRQIACLWQPDRLSTGHVSLELKGSEVPETMRKPSRLTLEQDLNYIVSYTRT